MRTGELTRCLDPRLNGLPAQIGPALTRAEQEARFAHDRCFRGAWRWITTRHGRSFASSARLGLGMSEAIEEEEERE